MNMKMIVLTALALAFAVQSAPAQQAHGPLGTPDMLVSVDGKNSAWGYSRTRLDLTNDGRLTFHFENAGLTGRSNEKGAVQLGDGQMADVRQRLTSPEFLPGAPDPARDLCCDRTIYTVVTWGPAGQTNHVVATVATPDGTAIHELIRLLRRFAQED